MPCLSLTQSVCTQAGNRVVSIYPESEHAAGFFRSNNRPSSLSPSSTSRFHSDDKKKKFSSLLLFYAFCVSPHARAFQYTPSSRALAICQCAAELLRTSPYSSRPARRPLKYTVFARAAARVLYNDRSCASAALRFSSLFSLAALPWIPEHASR